MSDKTVVEKAAIKWGFMTQAENGEVRVPWPSFVDAVREVDEESAATIRSLLYAFEHANNRDHPYTDWCDGCNPKAALAQARRSK